MDFFSYFAEEKELQSSILDFIDSSETIIIDNQQFVKILENKKQQKDKNEIKNIIRLLMTISNDHHRCPNFFDKIEQIFFLFHNEIKELFSDDEIYNLIKSNKRILLYFLQEKILTLQTSMIDDLYKTKQFFYFSPEIKFFFENEKDKSSKIFNEVNKYLETIDDFDKKRQEGENETYICQLIRNDSIVDFVSYINRLNISISSHIETSIFETNNFLIDKKPSLIEYATFFGSIQIFQYLKFNNADLTKSLWLYAIHGRNPELIHLLEENKIKSPNIECFIESLKCHHNELANYLSDNLLSQDEYKKINVLDYIFQFSNYEYASNDLDHHKFFCYLCQYNFTKIVKLLFENKSLKIAAKNYNIDIINLLLSYSEVEIPKKLFHFWKQIIEFTVPKSITRICKHAFEGCEFLRKITIPDSVTIIEEYAFRYCESLNDIKIPSSLISIEEGVFKQCYSLKEIDIPSSVIRIESQSFSCCKSLTKITIPPSVTDIGDSAFSCCSSLIQIEIPSSITVINNGLFWHCESLEKVIIPSNITSIENDAFLGCSLLNDISIPNSVTSYGFSAFCMCSSITEIIIPPSVERIWSHTFSGCESLKSIEIPSSVIFIDDYAFYNCSSLESVTIPSSITSINNNVFEKCKSLTTVFLPSTITSIGIFAFAECTFLNEIIIPDSVKSIQYYAFYECSSLKKVKLSPIITSIDKCTFKNCISLTQILIPASVTSIEKESFMGCISLKQLSFENNCLLKSIKESAFEGCISLKQVSIPSSVTSVEETTFKDCPFLNPKNTCSLG